MIWDSVSSVTRFVWGWSRAGFLHLLLQCEASRRWFLLQCEGLWRWLRGARQRFWRNVSLLLALLKSWLSRAWTAAYAVTTSQLQRCQRLKLKVSQWWYSKRAPLLLTMGGMALQLSCQAAILIAICVLWYKSERYNGIATVPETESPFFDSSGFHAAPILSSSIVWSTVPAWILSAYSALWSAMLDAFKKAQPTLELHRGTRTPVPGAASWSRFWGKIKGKLLLWAPLPRRWRSPPGPVLSGTQPRRSTARRTLLLDYGEWPIWNGWKAMRAGHVLMGACLILRSALWTAGGLSAAIFAVTDVPFDKDLVLSQERAFDQYLGYSFEQENYTSLMPSLDLVSATVVRNGDDYPWTTNTHSFLPASPPVEGGLGNYTFDTEAYWAEAECDVFSEGDLEAARSIELVGNPGEELDFAYVRFGFVHQGCKIEKQYSVANNTVIYGRAWSVDRCGLLNGYARVGILVGVYDRAKKYRLANLALVVCKPTLYRSNVTLEVSIQGEPETAKVLKFTEKDRESFWPSFADDWFHDLPTYNVIGSKNGILDVDVFSRLVVSYASKEPVLRVIAGREAIRQSFVTIFKAAFSNFVTLQAYSPSLRRPVAGKLTREQPRLFVVDKAAFAVVGIVAASFVTTWVLTFHLFWNRKTLEKHLDLMLGNALLFRDGPSSQSTGLDDFLRELRRKAAVATPSGAVNGVDPVKLAQNDEDLGNWQAWIEGTPGVVHMGAPLYLTASSSSSTGTVGSIRGSSVQMQPLSNGVP